MSGKLKNAPRPLLVTTSAEVIEARDALANLLARAMARVGMDYSRPRVTALSGELHRLGLTAPRSQEGG